MYIPYRLGLDLGTNSLGFALVALDRHDTPSRILHMGVRIFSDGREDKTKTSLAVARRTARGMRRHRDRFLHRQQRVMEALIAAGLMPQDKTERKRLELLNPYALRVKGLDEKLTPHELGRALFHINQRRGFKSNRKADKEEAGKVNSAIAKLVGEMQAQGWRTYGEFLCHLPPESSKRIRTGAQQSQSQDETPEEGEGKKATKTPYDFYPRRDMLEREYDALLQKQASYHPVFLTPEVADTLRNEIFHQRKLCPVKRGKCCVLEGKERAFSALPSAQLFRLLKEVNNLKIVDRFVRRNWEYLSDEHRQKALEYLQRHAEVKFSSLAKQLKLEPSERFNLESDMRDRMHGLPTSVALSSPKCFGEIWHSMPLERQDEIVMALLENDDEDAAAWLHKEFPELAQEQISAILSVSLEDSMLRYSPEALYQLIPQLESLDEEGRYKNECEAVKACGWPYANHYTGEIMADELPYYGELLERKTQAVKYGSELEKEYGRIANPTVHVALNQLRKVMNEIIHDWGHPKEIAIEFSRELKLTKKEKEHRNRENRKNQDANRRYDEAAREAGYTPSNDTRLRQKLWERQERRCLYSGKELSLSEALSAEADIDHILPRSQTLDDKIANKALVLRELNRHKGNRTPYAAFCVDKHPKVPNYEELLLRVEHTMGNQKWRFLEDAMQRFGELDGWLARQLTDTSYMARVAREYLRYVVGDRVKGFPAVDSYPGGLTAKIRHEWGFDTLLPEPSGYDKTDPDSTRKNREDHRHHAIDALVVACANRSMLHRINTASAKGEDMDADWLKKLSSPFPREEVQQKVDAIIISHKPDHGTPGQGGGTSSQLHEDTFYGMPRSQGKTVGREEPKKGQLRYHVRKPLITLKEKDIADIVDDMLRRKVADALSLRGNRKYEEAIAEFANKEKIHRVRVYVEKGEKAMKAFYDKEGNPYRYAATGGNHHIDIYCPIKDKKELKAKAGQWYAETVSHFDANQKSFVPQWKKDHPTAKLVMRLHINDMIAYEENGKREIRRVKKIEGTNNRVYLVPHLAAGVNDSQWAASSNSLFGCHHCGARIADQIRVSSRNRKTPDSLQRLRIADQIRVSSRNGYYVMPICTRRIADQIRVSSRNARLPNP